MRVVTFLLACTAWWASTAASGAQPAVPAPVSRADLHGSLGWANVQHSDLTDYDDWDHGVAQGAVGVGWYWTDHLKTEVEVAAHTRANFYTYEPVNVGNQVAYRSSHIHVRVSSLSVVQAYQFGRNAWVHPFVAAGIDIRRRAQDADVDPVFAYDQALRQSREIAPGHHVAFRPSYDTRALLAGGLKAYVSSRAFLRTELRGSLGSQARDIVIRVGVGVDF